MATLQKTLRFSDEVVDVFRNMIWSEDGREGGITWQLSPKLYKDTKKAIEALGGWWDKRAKIHRFEEDPRPKVFGLIVTGTLTVERDGFFPTPAPLVRGMIEHFPQWTRHLTTLEPSAGDGAIIRWLIEEGFKKDLIFAIEKNPKRCEVLRGYGIRVACGDFLKFRNSAGRPFMNIIMNPPFELMQDVDHVRRAYDLLAPGGRLVSIMSESPFFRGDKKAAAFREWLEGVGGWSYTNDSCAFRESGTDVSTRTVVIKKAV